MGFETDKNATGFSVSISFQDGKISITVKSRLTAGEPLKVVSKDDVSDAQLYAVCEVLDEMP